MPKKLEAKQKKKLVIGLAVFLLLGFLTIKRLGGLRDEKEAYKTTRVERGTIKETVSASGTIEAKQQVELHFQTLGKVSWVGVTEGDIVKKGQALAKLDTVILNNQHLQAQNSVQQATEVLDEFIDTYRDNLSSPEKIHKRTQLEKAVDSARLAASNAAKSLADATLMAPFGGVVISISNNIVPGANISLVDAITIADTSEFKFMAQVDEVDYGQIEIGQEVEISLDSFSDEMFLGIVSYIGKEGIKTAGGGVTIPIEIQFNPDGNNLAVGLNGDVEFIIEQKESVLIVPREYVKTKNGSAIVYLLKAVQPEERKVETGLTTLSQVEIIEGLEEGEKIVLVKNNQK